MMGNSSSIPLAGMKKMTVEKSSSPKKAAWTRKKATGSGNIRRSELTPCSARLDIEYRLDLHPQKRIIQRHWTQWNKQARNPACRQVNHVGRPPRSAPVGRLWF